MRCFSGDEAASLPGAAQPRRWPKAHLSRRAGSMRQQPTNGVGLHTVRGGIDPGDLRFSAKDVGVLQMLKDFLSGDEKILSPGATGPRSWQEGQLSSRDVSMSPGQSTTSQWRGRFHAVPGGIDLRDHRFHIRGFRIVHTWKDFISGDDILSSPGAAGLRSWPEGQPSLHANST